VIYEVFDFGISLYDEHLDLIAEAPGLTFFLGANDYAIRKGVEFVGLENLEQGDIVILNYPYWNSAHSMDMTLFAPIFEEGELRPFAFACVRAHWMDLGAKDPGYVLDSTDMHQEGLIFPGTKVYKRGKPDREILDLIRFNSRMPELVLGDLAAQVAAVRTGERRLIQIRRKFGYEQLKQAITRIMDHGETMTLEALATLPSGEWQAEDYLDDDGVSDEPIKMVVKVKVEPGRFSVDFSGSSAAVPGPVNVPVGLTQTMCKVVLKSLTTPQLPSSAGNFRPLSVIAPPGNLFHAVYPSATFTLWSAIVGLELICKALAVGMGEQMAASSGGDVPGFMMLGNHPATGRFFAISNNDAVGWGATQYHDGNNATNHVSGSLVRNTPVEVMEMKTGMRIDRLELRTDSGGAGRFRGGLGQRRDLYFVSPGEMLSVMKKTKTQPWALAGGLQPPANSMVMWPGTPREKHVGTFRAPVAAGDQASNLTGGGGGDGAPLERAPERVLEDVLDGYVSVAAAHQVYGVLIDLPTRTVDLKATSELREKRLGM